MENIRTQLNSGNLPIPGWNIFEAHVAASRTRGSKDDGPGGFQLLGTRLWLLENKPNTSLSIPTRCMHALSFVFGLISTRTTPRCLLTRLTTPQGLLPILTHRNSSVLLNVRNSHCQNPGSFSHQNTRFQPPLLDKYPTPWVRWSWVAYSYRLQDEEASLPHRGSSLQVQSSIRCYILEKQNFMKTCGSQGVLAKHKWCCFSDSSLVKYYDSR